MRRFFSIILAVLFVFCVIYSALFIRIFRVSGDSMFPTMRDGALVLVDTFVHKVGSISRWDLLIYHAILEDQGWPIIKRVLGLPWEEILIRSGEIYLNNQKIEENYLLPGMRTCVPGDCTSLDPITYSVPKNSYFVLGDNRLDSRDSRGCSNLGQCGNLSPIFIPFDEVIWTIFWSF